MFHKDKPRHIKETYVGAVCDIRTQKTETHRTILNVGGNIIDYPGDISTPTSDLTTMQIHVNIAISYVKSRYICMDLRYFYLKNMMGREEYIMIQIAMIPHEFVENIITKKNHTMDKSMQSNQGTFAWT